MYKIELMDVSKLHPYERNSRTHTPKQIEALRKSIERFGFVGAVVTRDGVLAKGHGVLEAVQAIYKDGGRLYPAPGKKAGAKPFPKGTVPVLCAKNWTDAQFKAFVIADNRIAEQSGWDRALLAEELPLIDDDPDLAGLMADLDMDELLAKANLGGRYDFYEPEGEAEPEHASEPEPKPKAEPDGHSVAFALDDAEWARWTAAKTKYPEITPRAVFLEGLEARL